MYTSFLKRSVTRKSNLLAVVALAGALVALEATAPVSFSAQAHAVEPGIQRAAQVNAANPYLVGAGVGDMTGEPGEVGFQGYGESKQAGSGIMTREYARAFLIQDPASGARNIMVVIDALSANETLRNEVIRQVRAEFGNAYGEANIMISATHTHSTPGSGNREPLYNVTTSGWHEDTYKAAVAGTMQAIRAAHADLAPGNLTISHTKLTGVGVNRSAQAQVNNSPELLGELIDGVDPTNITMRLERDGQVRAVINWFAIHPTSLPSSNTLISSDNKGYAQWLIENKDNGVDYYSGAGNGFVAAFANSNGGDVTPNTFLQPGKGPTNDAFTNMKIQGEKQANEVRKQLTSPGTPVGTGLGSAIHYRDFSKIRVAPEYTGTGRWERTCDASLGQSFAAGSTEDGGGGLSVFGEGVGANPFFNSLAKATYKISPDLKACQAPKDNLLAVGLADYVQQKLPVQMMRFGNYYVLGLPGELTSSVGVQYRKDLANTLGVPESNIIIQGYTNAYSHYVTTPQEYDFQQYEGGATLFGRYTMPAYRQVINEVAVSMRDGKAMPLGTKPSNPAVIKSLTGKVVYDLPGVGQRYGNQTVAPKNVSRGTTVAAEFVGAHPNNDLQHNSSYLEIQRWNGSSWVYVTSDNDPETRYSWARRLAAQSRVTISWNVPADAVPGQYRILYYGDAKNGLGKISSFTGTSSSFTVR